MAPAGTVGPERHRLAVTDSFSPAQRSVARTGRWTVVILGSSQVSGVTLIHPCTHPYKVINFKSLRILCLSICLVGFGLACSPSPSDVDGRGPGDNPADPLASALVTPVHVRVTPATAAGIGRQATAAGVLEAFRTATVAAETDGRVVSRSVEPGDPVSAGQALVTLDNEKALIARNQAQARVRSREVDLEQAGNELERGRDLRAREFISEDALENLGFTAARARSALEAARADLDAAARVLADTEVRAPFAGIAERVHVHVGDYLKSGTPVVALADFSRVRIKAGVTAREAELLAGAESARVTLDAIGAAGFSGRINSLARVSDAATGTYTLEIWLEDLPGDLRDRLREGMLATVYLPHADARAPLTVPSTAVFRRGGAMHVFVVNAGHALLVPVDTGRTNGPVVEVLGGLAEGDLVVTDGQFALRDGAPVTVED